MRVKIKLVDDRKLSNCQGFFRLCCLGANGATLEALDSIVFLSGLADGSFCFFIGAVYNSGGIGVVLVVVGVINSSSVLRSLVGFLCTSLGRRLILSWSWVGLYEEGQFCIGSSSVSVHSRSISLVFSLSWICFW